MTTTDPRPLDARPSEAPTAPTDVPTDVPAAGPTDVPAAVPSDAPADVPVTGPSDVPTDVPADVPVTGPTDVPTAVPVTGSTEVPTAVPVTGPTDVPADRPGDGPVSLPVRAVLAATSLGAAGIHLAMVPTHADEWPAEGVAFAVAGWLQVALAVAFVARPTRSALRVAAVANVVFVAAWAWTRTAGAPFGPEAGEAHDAGFVDLTCVALEAVTAALAVAVLVRPRLGGRLPRRWYAPLAAVPAAVLVLATAAIASPGATDHAHADSATTATDGGHGHGAPGAEATAAEDDRGLSLLENGEMAHHYGPDQPLDAPTRAALVHQLELTRLFVERFPTLADAEAAGSRPAGGFSPGLGLHMSLPGTGLPEAPPPGPTAAIPGTLTDAEVLRPANLIYDGTTDDARLAGFMYYSTSPEEPEGFAGPNDHWHTHGELCVKVDGGVEVLHPADRTRAGCEAIDGMWIEQTTFMVHVWTVPGYESNRGVFSDVNPAIACPDGTYYTIPEDQHERYPVNKCRSNPE